jgi:hypothetical protein
MPRSRELAELATSYDSGGSLGFRNRIINGDCRIDQRNAGASVTPTSGSYTLDRWLYVGTQASKISVQQNAGAVTPPTGFTNYFGATSLAATSVGSTDYFSVAQNIEGFNCADLGWGSASASPVTLSFWVRSSLTGTFGGALYNQSGSVSYPFSYSIPVANTWTQISISIAGPTSGSIPSSTTNGLGFTVSFALGVGSTLSGTAGSWGSTLYRSVTGATSVVGTNGATFYITGVQLEAGSVATPFERRDYGRELIMCQRYFTPIGGNLVAMLNGSGNAVGFAYLPVTPRATPAVSYSGTAQAIVFGVATYSSTTQPSGISVSGNNLLFLITGFGATPSSGTGQLANTIYLASMEL